MTTKTTQQDATRASYHRARALADRLVDQVPTLPNAAEAHRSFALDSYEARLHFGVGLDAGRGVLETAALVDTEPVREAKHSGKGELVAYWIGLRTVVDGVPLSAWALTNEADADILLPPAELAHAEDAARDPETTATQPMPTVSADPAVPVAPAITPVPLAAMKTVAAPAPAADQDDEARCVKCGCTEDAACDGGCYWVPNQQMVDLCSACATPQQITAMVFAPVSSAGTRAGGE